MRGSTQMQSPCLAAQREPRDRGVTTTERRAAEAAAEVAAEQQRRAQRAESSPKESSPKESSRVSPMGACSLGRGRAAMKRK